MFRQVILKSSFRLITILSILAGWVAMQLPATKVLAQTGPTPTPLPTTVPGLTISPGVAPGGAPLADTGVFDITLAKLGYNDRVLYSPVGTTEYYFSLPVNWVPAQGGYVDLNLQYQVSTRVTNVVGSGNVEILLNRNLLKTYYFNGSGVAQLHLEIPPEYILTGDNPSLNRLQINFVDATECEDLIESTLIVKNTSLIHLAYTARPMVIDLAQFPKPLYYQQSFFPQQARFVLPAAASAGDLQAAASIAARLGKLTAGDLPLQFSTAAEIPPAALQSEHLIAVGRPEDNELIRNLDLPLPLGERQYQLSSEMPSAVTTKQEFTVVLKVKNTLTAPASLEVEDRWPVGANIMGCADQCIQLSPNVLEWKIASLAPGQEVSQSVRVQLDPNVFELGDVAVHTASLRDNTGKVLNVDTLSAGVSLEEGSQKVASPEKGRYFFVNGSLGVPESDGVIQEMQSPWGDRQTVLVVTGLSEEAVHKAGVGLGSDTILKGAFGTYAVVQATTPLTSTTQGAEVSDITLEQLGNTDEMLSVFYDQKDYPFSIPRGWQLTEDTLLGLHFAHGAALNTMEASLEIYLNDTPVYSIKLNETNVENTWNSVPLPQRLFRSGNNTLSFVLSGVFDRCMNEKFARGMWVTIFKDSFLHLPHLTGPTDFSLADYPAPFSDSYGLAQVAFLLPEKSSFAETEAMLRLAYVMGSAAGSNSFMPEVRVGGEPDEQSLRDKQLIAIGLPTQNRYIAAANATLPLSFIPGSDEIRQTIGNVIYQLPPGLSVGLIQLLSSPWDANQAMLAITGTTAEGIQWASDALINANLADQMNGNLVIGLRPGEINSIDTRKATAVPGAGDLLGMLTNLTTPQPGTTHTPVPTSVPVPTATPTAVAIAESAPPAVSALPVAQGQSYVSLPVFGRQPAWLLLILVASILVVAVAIVIYMRQTRS